MYAHTRVLEQRGGLEQYYFVPHFHPPLLFSPKREPTSSWFPFMEVFK